jgi:hypothetical protein
VWEPEGEDLGFPVQRTAISNFISSGEVTGFTLTFASAVAGDTLVAIIGIDGEPTVSGLSGWAVNEVTATVSDHKQLIISKVAANDGEAVAITISAAERVAAKLLAYAGACAVTVGTSDVGAGTTVAANPPSLTTTDANNLWIAAVTQSGSGTAISSGIAPTDYAFLGSIASGGTTSSYVRVHAAYREFAGATQNPGAFSQNVTYPVATTVAIRRTA